MWKFSAAENYSFIKFIGIGSGIIAVILICDCLEVAVMCGLDLNSV